MTTTTTKATETTQATQYPLADAIIDAEAALEAALDDDDVDQATCDVLARRKLAAARAALADSSEPRLWELADDGGSTETVLACSLAEAKAEAEDWVRGSSWDTSEETCWIDVHIRCEQTGEEDDITVAIDPPEPRCSADDHEWTSPEWLGGCRENPGVWGHGGGVRIIEVCRHCGCARHTDTWAQRDTGEQGLESVSYTPGYADEHGPCSDDE